MAGDVYVGAPLEQVSEVPVGSVHYYDRTTWAHDCLDNPNSSGSGDFGRTMAADGSNLFVSDPYNYSTFRYYGGILDTDPSTYTLSSPESREFGYALATLDGHIVVGDPGAADNAPTAGAAYIYSAAGTSPATTIANLSDLCVPDVSATDEPGMTLEVLGQYILIGYPGTDNPDNCGLIEIRDLSFTLIRTITKPSIYDDPVAGDMLGFSVKWIDSDYFLASSPGRTVDGIASAGEVYLFDATDGTVIQRYTNPNPGEGDLFGAGIEIQGDYVLINSMPEVEDPRNSGAVSVFEMDFTGNTPDAACLGSFMTFKNHFGTSVAAMGENVLIGAPDADFQGVIDAGRAYLMSPDSGWPILTLSTESTADGPGDGDQFGYQVAAAGNNILVSAPGRTVDGVDGAGAVFLFDANGNLRQTFENPTPEEGDEFGMAISVMDDYVLVGAPYHDEGDVTNSGAAYLFPIDPTGADPNPAPIATFLNPDADAEDWFGWSLCGAGDDIVIGAPQHDDMDGVDVGAAYHYEWSITGQTWTNCTDLTFPGFSPPNDLFGWSVSIVGDQFLVTARAGDEDASISESGKAYLFDRETLGYNLTLQSPSPQPAEGFGWSGVSVQGNRVLITAASLQSGTQTGDLNDDDMVGSSDLDIVRSNWGQSVTPGDLAAGDPSGDGLVGGADLDIIRAHWGEQLPPAVAGAAYLFDAEDGQLLRTFVDPESAEYNFFGMSAIMVGSEVFVSAPNASLVVSEEGVVYRFDMGTQTELTDASGVYQFSGLDEGTYRIRQLPSAGYYQQTSSPYTHSINVTESSSDFTGKDFGIAVGSATLTGNSSVDEGSTYTATLSVTSGQSTVEYYTVHWGDGTCDIYTPAQLTALSGQLSHVYQDGDGDVTISVDLTDEYGTHVGVASQDITVNNVAPTLSVTSEILAPEDASGYWCYAITVRASDPGADTITSWEIDWDDDDNTTSSADDPGFNLDANAWTVSYLYDTEATYNISISATDEDDTYVLTDSVAIGSGHVTTLSTSTSTNNGKTLSLAGDESIDEGGEYTLGIEVDDQSTLGVQFLEIDWGDGSANTTGTVTNEWGDIAYHDIEADIARWTATHVYADSGRRSIHVTATFNDGTTADLDAYLNSLLPGDANRDGIVDDVDATILASNYQMATGAAWQHGDFDADGDVDSTDKLALQTNWQQYSGILVDNVAPVLTVCADQAVSEGATVFNHRSALCRSRLQRL